MSYFTYTTTIANGQAADGDLLMQNFNDALNGVTDGTKDINVAALTAAGAATFNGTVALGNATGDDITITGYVASNLVFKTSGTYDIGTANLGLRSIYMTGTDVTSTLRLLCPTMTGDYTLTLPADVTDTLVGKTTTDTLTNKRLTSPKLNEDVAVTTTATKLNYITSATGTTGTDSTNIVFSTSPTFVTPVLGAATATSVNFGATSLAHYQEGTFTLTGNAVVFAGGSGTMTDSGGGTWTRIGKLVFVTGLCTITKGTAAGALTLVMSNWTGDVPPASANISNNTATGVAWFTAANAFTEATVNKLIPNIGVNSSTIYLSATNDTTTVAAYDVIAADLDTAAVSFYFSITYRCA